MSCSTDCSTSFGSISPMICELAVCVGRDKEMHKQSHSKAKDHAVILGSYKASGCCVTLWLVSAERTGEQAEAIPSHIPVRI